MLKKDLPKVFAIVILLVTLACSSLSSISPSSIAPTAQVANPSPTKPIVTQATNTKSATAQVVPTSTPSPSIEREWTIKTGDLQLFGVAADGTIYGVNPSLYAVISKDGDVSQATKIDLKDCLSDRWGGSSDMAVDSSFVVKPDGTIRSKSAQFACTISPGDPPKIEKVKTYDFFPYADDATSKMPGEPDGFINNQFNPYVYSLNLKASSFFINKNQKLGAFVDHNAHLQTFSFPEDLDLSKLPGEARMGITPWDDVYISYQSYDALGNNIGEKTIRIKPDGTVETINNFPQIDYRITDLNSLTNFLYAHPNYLPERKELYVYEGTSIRVFDLDYKYLREYPLPSDFPEMKLSGVAQNYLFIGHDGNAYVFDPSKDIERTLTKYLISPNSINVDVTPTAQVTLDQDAIAFRDKALIVLKELTTVEYSIKEISSDPSSNGLTGNGKSTPNASDTVMFNQDGTLNQRLIQVDNTVCTFQSNAVFNCETGNNNYIFASTTNILNGNPGDTSSAGKVISQLFSSKLDVYNGVNCRSFSVEVNLVQDNTNVQGSAEVCLDLNAYTPVRWLNKIYVTAPDGNVYWDTVEYFDPHFNVQIEPIVVPQ